MSGLSMGMSGLTVLPEHIFLVALVSHSLAKTPGRLKQKSLVSPTPSPHLMLAGTFILCWLLTVAAFSLFNSPSPMSSLRLLVWLSINVIALLVVKFLEVETAQLVGDALRACTVVFPLYIAAWAAANATGVRNIFVEADYASATFRLKGLMLEPNLLAGLALLMLCVAFSYRDQLNRSLFLASAAVLTFAIFVTYTRAAWVVLFFVIAHSIWSSKLRHKILFIFSFTVLTATLALLFADGGSIQAGSIVDTIRSRFESLTNFESGTGAYRFRIWSIAIEEINEDGWFFGHGYNAFAQSHSAADTSDGTLYLSLLWLALVYDGGLIAFMLFTGAFLLLWTKSKAGSIWFYVAFITLSTSTNPIWYMFPWVFAVLLVPSEASLPSGPRDAVPEALGVRRTPFSPNVLRQLRDPLGRIPR
ncbi:O-antigen ligase family protein [Pseudarthrobacter enclensis]|uniref:O-antigen ligase family protein n=1 Tax=Pseudarthrobacter enclensis TaxID=993070 RepID=UPI0036CD1175